MFVRKRNSMSREDRKTWSEAIRNAAISGSVASLTSTAVLAARSASENGTPFAATNAISHCLWGKRALREDNLSAHYTLVGYGIHHASAILWAAIYEKLFGARADDGQTASALTGGAAVAALAYAVDYTLTPQRLRPGYEERLSKPSLLLAYGALGLSFALRGLISHERRHRQG